MTSLFSTVPFLVVMMIDPSNIVYDRHESISSNHIHICWIYHEGGHRWKTVLQHGAASTLAWLYRGCSHRIVLEMLRSLCRWRSAGNVVPLFPPSENSETTALHRWLRLTSFEEVNELVDSSLRFFRWSSWTVTAISHRSFENKVEWKLERSGFSLSSMMFATEWHILFLVEKSLANIKCLLDCLYVRRVKRTSPQHISYKTWPEGDRGWGVRIWCQI